MNRKLIALGAALIIVGMVTGCTATAQSSDASAGASFSDGDFQVAEIAVADRGEPVQFEGVIETGETVTSDDYRGEVLVVNFWYAACGPCIVEAPMLEEVFLRFQDEGVDFLGVNTYDQAETALSFARENKVTYPSVIDVNDGQVKLAFAQLTPIQATPTTLVMDRQGRLAARIIGQLPSASILSSIVADTLAEAP
ncbi:MULTISPECIES: TlpA family protein disulfide reductase [unclassified Microbacterium]|jgi:peroxiredoxin|uniref:TlpA family protein disulfide reductase n=1 Tax=unclassified Microbacterium TaxID=2609290 RepID=UPI0010FDFF0E|nr:MULTISPECIES: TlpA disulfide reductase family protein [unclassified Microbacterium]MBT9608244.1 TlpA family protein disulfide reductase [Microbacterium sp.]TLF31043.1 TlpA family protein disulfide reductase [Microbacterium sp. 5K110]CAH0268870.1 Thiol-disulfide oxidoreductase ResA [Microbacterium sp. Bi128]